MQQLYDIECVKGNRMCLYDGLNRKINIANQKGILKEKFNLLLKFLNCLSIIRIWFIGKQEKNFYDAANGSKIESAV